MSNGSGAGVLFVPGSLWLWRELELHLSVSPAMSSEATWLGEVTEAEPGVQTGRWHRLQHLEAGAGGGLSHQEHGLAVTLTHIEVNQIKSLSTVFCWIYSNLDILKVK